MSRVTSTNSNSNPSSPSGNSLVHDLVEAGIHFGQRSAGWNPKMQPFIYGKRNGIHIIDIKETVKGLLLAKKFISRTVADGKDVCFVGTKRQARSVIEQRVGDVKMHFVTERWLGGTLTNFRTIRARLRRLEELEAIEKNDNFASYSKKMESQLRREKDKIFRNLSGIRSMDKLPGALVVIDVTREVNALREAKKLGIPTICLIDTDADPELADIPIPGNDDSMRSIDVIIRELCMAVNDGKQARGASKEGEPARDAATNAGAGGGNADRPRRSSRAKFRADDAGSATAGDDEVVTRGATEPAKA
ncbi:MAG: 30S ribosomal protein S2 [Phycisphaerales bacterium]|nr:30S ribosomal protein S2 [Phycisphaerales bacterium]